MRNLVGGVMTPPYEWHPYKQQLIPGTDYNDLIFRRISMDFQFGVNTYIYIEPEAYEGVRRIGQKVAKDIEAVTGICPEVKAHWGGGQAIVCATLGKSPLAEKLLNQGILSDLTGKREVYQIALTEIEGTPSLVICGSDKRGTIYGMFALSEYIGVTPLCFFGDVSPVRRDAVTIGPDIETISKEPSVKYRGFFINDEWPCFGTWATKHFGDVNAECYDHIFELLLRMKGNYLWPAMWKSSFPLDGPGSANEELADLYGVVMGYSHHEPCLRASEEWDKVRGERSVYGDDWNYYYNEAGLLRYWEDALKRSGKYENIITIGMRGERDSSMLGDDSTLAENISLLKKIIKNQRSLIETYVPRKATQLLALYKEVEAYFYGDETTQGLKDWKELEDVLFLLCEDNHGHLRTVPPRDMVNHPGGWGMYYHFDYHGGPVSYEWVDSTPLAQTWEAMTQAWDYGIRELWIVNVGDLKLHEVPLTYFMALAYDFEKWGTGNRNSPAEYMEQWTARNFPQASPAQREEIAGVFRDYVAMNSLRRPESLHAGVYHPCHEGETDRMLALAGDIEARSEALMQSLCPQERQAYYSMIHFSAMASTNLLKMHLYAGKNHHYAAQGKVIANHFAALTEQCIRRDLQLAEEFAAFRDGKWAGMELAPHIGFTRWNDEGSCYPVLHHVTPMPKADMKVSRTDREDVAMHVYGGPISIPVEDFCFDGCERVTLEIANGGKVPFHFTIGPVGKLPDWLTVEPSDGTVTEQTEVSLICDRAKLPPKKQLAALFVSDGNGLVIVKVAGKAWDNSNLPPMTFVPRRGVISMLAEHYSEKKDIPAGAFQRIGDYGKYGSGMKVFPTTAAFSMEDEKPGLTYTFRIDHPGDYRVEFLTAPNNPIELGSAVHLLAESGGAAKTVQLLPPDFRAGENSDPRWCQGVLDHIHTAQTQFHFEAGIHKLTVSPLEPGVVLEKIVISPRDVPLPPSYLGPEESWYQR